MRRFYLVLSFAFVLAMGCAAGTVYSHRYAEAQAPAGVQKWQVHCFGNDAIRVESPGMNKELDQPDGWNRALERLGAQGWEPVSFLSPRGSIEAVCLKRPQS